MKSKKILHKSYFDKQTATRYHPCGAKEVKDGSCCAVGSGAVTCAKCLKIQPKRGNSTWLREYPDKKW